MQILELKFQIYLKYRYPSLFQQNALLFSTDLEKLTEIEKANASKVKNLLEQNFPLDYLLKKIEILEKKFFIDENCLIPRSETIDFLEQFKKLIPSKIYLKKFNLFDLGTGSGLIGINLAHFFNQIFLSDIDIKTLKICHQNLLENKIYNYKLFKANLLLNQKLKIYLRKKPYILISNLPYIPSSEKNLAIQNQVNFEPEIALYGGIDGLFYIRKLAKILERNKNIRPKIMFLELDPRNIQKAYYLFKPKCDKIFIKKDFSGLSRYLIVKFDKC